MTQYIRQHWLPKSYLKNFKIKRYIKSTVYRFDGEKSIPVPVKSQCFKKHFYSSKNRKEAEKEFWKIEKDFPKYVAKILNYKPVSRRERIDIIFIIFIYHLRTAAYENRTDYENIVAFRIRFNNFFASEISELDEKNIEQQNIMQGLSKNWELQMIHIQNDILITSDHPVLIFRKRIGPLLFAILPIIPQKLLVAFDKRYMKIISCIANEKDRLLLNNFQAGQSILAIYSNKTMDRKTQENYKNVFKKHRKPYRGYTNTKVTSTEFIVYKGNFSFIEITSNRTN